MALIYTPLYIYSRMRRPMLQGTILLAFLVTASHPILDLGSLTPILWPIYPNSITIKLALNGVVNEGIGLRPQLSINQAPTSFTRVTGIDYPLFTGDGILTTLILLAPIIYKQIKHK
jgi:hypothetical protein